MRRPILLALVWVLAALAAASLSLLVLGSVSDQLASAAPRPVAGTSVTSSPNTTASAPTSAVAVGSAAGGSATVSCAAGRARLVAWSPANGWRVHDTVKGPATEVEVEFAAGDSRSEVKARCVSGTPVFETETSAQPRESDDDNSGPGSGGSGSGSGGSGGGTATSSPSPRPTEAGDDHGGDRPQGSGDDTTESPSATPDDDKGSSGSGSSGSGSSGSGSDDGSSGSGSSGSGSSGSGSSGNGSDDLIDESDSGSSGSGDTEDSVSPLSSDSGGDTRIEDTDASPSPDPALTS